MQFEIKPSRYRSAAARQLIAALQEDIKARYGTFDDTPVEALEFDPPDGGFFVAYADREPVGCGAWRSYGGSDKVAEVKRVFVAEKARGRGLARRIMAALEDDARAHGRTRVILETGTAQPEAMALYQALSYEPIEGFGYYKDEPESRCFGKDV